MQQRVDNYQQHFRMAETTAGKVNHLLRMVPPSVDTHNFAKDFDSGVMDLIKKTAQVRAAEQLPELSQVIVRLSRHHGGLSLANAHCIDRAAYLGSVAKFLQQRHLLPEDVRSHHQHDPSRFAAHVSQIAVDFQQAFSGVEDADVPLPKSLGELVAIGDRLLEGNTKTQAYFARHVHKFMRGELESLAFPEADRREELKRAAVEANKQPTNNQPVPLPRCPANFPPKTLITAALLRSNQLFGARFALDAMPVDRHLRMKNVEFQSVLQTKLLLPRTNLIPSEVRGQACCQSSAEDRHLNTLSEQHLAVCPFARRFINQRHTALVDCTASILRLAGLRPKVEPRVWGANGNDGPDIRVTLDATEYALDLTTAVVEQASNNWHAAIKDYYRAETAEKRKTQRYAAELAADHVKLLTLCFESTGALGPEFQRFWNLLAHHITTNRIEPVFPRTWATPTFISYAQHRLAVCHARQNVRVIMKRVNQLQSQSRR